MTTYLEIHQRQLADVCSYTATAVARLAWSRDQVLEEQRRALRKMVRLAQEGSPFYAKRIGHLESSTMELSDLEKIPPLTKADVMENWDDLVTDRRLKLADMNIHLSQLLEGKTDNAYYLNEYYASATGGTTGKRGLYLWDWETVVITSNITYRMLARRDQQVPPQPPKRMAVICAGSLVHGSRMVFPTTLDPEYEVRIFAAGTPMPEIVAALNEWPPDRLVGYASLVHEMVEQTRRGALRIRPKWVMTNSEPLDASTRALSREVWGVDIHNSWGSVEIGLAGMEGDSFGGLTLAEDYFIFEPIAADGSPVRGAETAERTLVTKLFGKVLPLLRYEMTDTLVFDDGSNPDAPGMRRVLEIKGRADTFFVYDDVKIHPMVFRGVLGQVPVISEYQVQQTARGARVLAIVHGELDANRVAADLNAVLGNAQLPDAEVSVEAVEELPRHAETNKLKRFVPL